MKSAINNSFAVRPLTTSDAGIVAAFMRSQSAEYLRFFYAFSADETAIAETLAAVESDIYAGVFWQEKLAGVYMLRGWDEGYEVPAFGVLIDEKFRGNALLHLTVDTAKTICKLMGINKYMVKIHPDNTALKNVHRMGFYRTGIEELSGNVIFHIDF